MRSLFDAVSEKSSKLATQSYSTSFTMGIRLLDRKHHQPIYNLYGFVRFADEIVDTFSDQDQRLLLDEFKAATHLAVERQISLNPILNAFQKTVNTYNIEAELYDTFLDSMYMDLDPQEYDRATYEKYILGSADVVGLMCLRVFCEGNEDQYEQLKPFAMKLGSAFQKVNFLRDVKNDTSDLGRIYFPDVQNKGFGKEQKAAIEKDIENDFKEALKGIQQLPNGAKLGVYAAYTFYLALFKKMKATSFEHLLKERVRIPNFLKLFLVARSYVQCRLGLV